MARRPRVVLDTNVVVAGLRSNRGASFQLLTEVGREMSTLSVRLPHSLHRHLREVAAREGVSMNQLISSAVGEKLSALLTAEYLDERADRGSHRAYEAVLRRVRGVAPERGDELPHNALQRTSARRQRRARARR